MWYAINTKPRQEDRVAGNLAAGNIEVFSPKLKRKRLLRGKYQVAVEALFPSYIFSRFDAERQYNLVKYTRGVRSLVGPPGSPWPVGDEIISLISSRLGEDGFINIRSDFSEGDEVLITEGPLKGLMGILKKELPGRDRVIILLNAIEYQLNVEMEKEFLY